MPEYDVAGKPETFCCVECGAEKGRCDEDFCDYEFSTNEAAYWRSHPEEYEAMRVKWPQYQFGKWDHATMVREYA